MDVLELRNKVLSKKESLIFCVVWVPYSSAEGHTMQEVTILFFMHLVRLKPLVVVFYKKGVGDRGR